MHEGRSFPLLNVFPLLNEYEFLTTAVVCLLVLLSNKNEIRMNRIGKKSTVPIVVCVYSFNLFCFSDMPNTCDSLKRSSYVRSSIEW